MNFEPKVLLCWKINFKPVQLNNIKTCLSVGVNRVQVFWMILLRKQKFLTRMPKSPGFLQGVNVGSEDANFLGKSGSMLPCENLIKPHPNFSSKMCTFSSPNWHENHTLRGGTYTRMVNKGSTLSLWTFSNYMGIII